MEIFTLTICVLFFCYGLCGVALGIERILNRTVPKNYAIMQIGCNLSISIAAIVFFIMEVVR